MKTTSTWLLAGTLAAFCCRTGSAQTIIYSNAFDGGAVNIWRTAPNVAESLFGGTAAATWSDALGVNDTNAFYANGTVGTALPDSLLLPFQPQPGYIYTLSASLSFAGNPGGWVGVGFAQNDTSTAALGHGRFSDDSVTGYDWAILTEATGNVQFFAGPRGTGQLFTQNGFFTAGAATHTLNVVLNTTGAHWSIASYVDNVQVATDYAYGVNPPIGAVGLTQTALSAPANVHWDSLALSVAPLVITQQPVSAAVEAGSAFTNTVVAASGAPLCYQWFTNNIPIDGATNATLVFNPVSPANAGTNYDVVVTNTYGSVTSAVVSLSVLTNGTLNSAPSQLSSPDGRLVLTFALSNFDGSLNCPVYNLTRSGRTLLTTSKLGLSFGSGGLLQENLAIVSETNSANDNVWQPVYGEKSLIRDHYNQLVVNLQELVPPFRLLQVSFRVYNEGLALRYTIPAQPGLAGAANLTEQTEFRFDADYPAWATYTAQGVYSQTTLSGIASGCERPLPVELATNLYVALGEAGLVDYSRMKFAPLPGKPFSLVSWLDGPVTNSLPLTTPWRFVMAAGTPGGLLENDFLVLNLNDPAVLTNAAWIKPGKVIRETTLKTVSGKACVDFAARHHLSYIEFDAGWYGPENSSLTATNAISSLDLPGVINYAASNNVGVILYVNWLAMTNELALLPSLYRGWGVKGIKYGFVSVGPQQVTALVNEAARLCATNQMMLEVHDEFRPSGYTRTYPNFMTVEGVLGDEGTPTTAQDLTELFSRMLVGGADHTVCYFDSRVTNHWSYAYQLAKAVCFYSPWQYLYWYDRPTNSYGYVSGGNDMITEVPEMEFYDYLPTVWDETRVLQSSIGQYALIARRSGTQWFIGAMNANATRTFHVPLDFLTPGQKYSENIYSQDPSVPTRTQVRIERWVVDSTATLTLTLDASGGEAVRLLPAEPPRIQSLVPLPGGGCGLSITGCVSLPYSLWSSPDLALPGTNWTLLSSGLLTNSPLLLSDILTQTRRFYRCSTP